MFPPGSRIALCLALTLAARSGAAQTPTDLTVRTDALQGLLVAEDARGTGPEGLAPLLTALRSSDTLLHRLAIRGLGRLQRPELGRLLLPYLHDSLPSARAEAANAIAQSLRRVRRGATPADTSQLSTPEAAAALIHALSTEIDASVADMVARSLGRLGLPDSAAARSAEARDSFTAYDPTDPGAGSWPLHARTGAASTGNLELPTVALLRTAAVTAPDSGVRRLALATLALADGLDSATAVRAFADRDDEARRLTLRGSGALSAELRKKLVSRALADPSMIVRVEAIAAARLGANPPDCAPILAATGDREPYVVLTAIDSLGSGCADRAAAAAALRRLAVTAVTRGPPDHRWQVGAHAVLALAHLDSAAAAALLTRTTESPRAEVRQYAARAAAVVRRAPGASEPRRGPGPQRPEAAITGLATTAGS